MTGCCCKNASRKNTCKGRPDCSLRADHPERKSKPGEQDPKQWHAHYLWIPKKIDGRWYWLRTIMRRWIDDCKIPLNGVYPAPFWMYAI